MPKPHSFIVRVSTFTMASMAGETVEPKKDRRFPKGAIFVTCCDFFDAFARTGLTVILILHLRSKLHLSEQTSTIIYHSFMMSYTLLTLPGATLADSWIGKFRTVAYSYIIAITGFVLITASATPPFSFAESVFAFLGLSLIAMGIGIARPCLSVFGGEQFVLPDQEHRLTDYFTFLNVSVTIAGLVSMFVIPILRGDVSCYGDDTCFSLAFLVLTISMTIAAAIFMLGTPIYTIKFSKRNIVLEVFECIKHGICTKLKTKNAQPKEHWLDYADDKYDVKTITDIKLMLELFKLFLPLPMIFALDSQQGSRWTLQATHMDGRIGSFNVKPDQIGLFSTIIYVAFLIIMRTLLYSFLAKFNLLRTLVHRIILGACLIAAAVLISGVVELELEKTYTVLPSSGLAQLRIFNTMDCPIKVSVGEESFVLENLSVWENKYLKATGDLKLNYTADYTRCRTLSFTPELSATINGTINGVEATAVSWVATPQGLSHNYVDNVEETVSGKSAIRALVYLDGYMDSSINLEFVKDSKPVSSLNITRQFAETPLTILEPDTYDVYLNNRLLINGVQLKRGAVYTLIGNVDHTNASVANIVTITNPNSMSMLWLLPQCIIMSMGSVFFSVSTQELTFTKAPSSMKSTVMACWHITLSFGDLIVIIISKLALFRSQAYNSFLFAGLGWLDIVVFGVFALFYNSFKNLADKHHAADPCREDNSGLVNRAFEDDDDAKKFYRNRDCD